MRQNSSISLAVPRLSEGSTSEGNAFGAVETAASRMDDAAFREFYLETAPGLRGCVPRGRSAARGLLSIPAREFTALGAMAVQSVSVPRGEFAADRPLEKIAAGAALAARAHFQQNRISR